MRFDWSENLSVAEELVGKTPAIPSTEEARHRSAISRAYYAAFHASVRKLGKKIPAYENSHLAVVEYFEHNGSRAYRHIGGKLRRLLKDRRAADYDDEFPQLSGIAPKAVDNARTIIELIGAL